MSKGFGYQYSGTKGHVVGVASTLPSNPEILLKSGWEDISHPQQKAHGHMELKEKATGLRIRFDRGDKNASGFRKQNHYHIYNPSATGNRDLYLDKNGNPTGKNSPKSHILPEGEKQ